MHSVLDINNYNFDILYSELEDIVGSQNIAERYLDKLAYSVDIYWIPTMWIDRGVNPPTADIIVIPENENQVSKIVKLANEYRIPVVTWGGGSGSQGGVLPIYGGIMLDLKKMDKTIDINMDAGSVTVEAGKIGQQLEWELNKIGYMLPVL